MTSSAYMAFAVCMFAIAGLLLLFFRSRETITEKDEILSQQHELLVQMQQALKKYGPIIDLEQEQQHLTQHNASIKTKIKQEQARWNREHHQLLEKQRQLQESVSLLEEEEYIQSFGLYKHRYDFGSSNRYKLKLTEVRDEQKRLIKNGTAARCNTDWHVGESRKKGKKLTNDFLKLLLRAFNGECDVAISKVKYNNVDSTEKRIEKSWEALNKLGQHYHTEITREYVHLKLQELFLVHEYQEKKQEEKEEAKRIKEEMREEEKLLKALEKEEKQAQKEEERYIKALEKARAEARKASQDKMNAYDAKIRQLEVLLAEAAERKERAVSQAQLTKSGFVYVISNVGSFGENVFKIGLTRRLEPNDRVRELGGASVPFPFDVHAFIYSHDAPGLENKIHKALHNYRINWVNNRKEFFRVPLKTIEQVVYQHQNDIAKRFEFEYFPQAEEFRKSESARLAEAQTTVQGAF
ncbi:MAG TPA: DUF4041 domain-containing protein [Myxococcales bacterium]|nr:ATPase [Deltaproteobacteria bacterium]MBK07361.1 ATPase [Deltaproteobacteria bacterium]MBU53514.1 ATPase [Deltaproteobacteria bacterium]HAA55644.1 DUF4041 domain-containing protein [Myxococcales bacterium]